MDPFDSRQLNAFHELACEGSFTAAARNLHVTQSAISHSIKSLEFATGTKLFERLGKTVRLTREGETFLPHVRQILNSMQRAREELYQFTQPGHGRLRVGATVTIGQYILPKVMRELRESFPAYDFSITTGDTRSLIDALDGGEIDIAVGLSMSGGTTFEYTEIFSDEIGLAMSPTHPLASKKSITAESLAHQAFIFYSRNSETFRIVNRYFTKQKIPLRSPMMVGSMAAIKEMALTGMGIGLIAPWIATPELKSGALCYRPLPSKLRPSRSWGIYTDSKRERTLAEDVFIGITRNVFANIRLSVTEQR